ncbi:MAG: amidophosphoribosyltransferase, partial [Pseudomonadota bacterium]|nr:amidophosphoribosyltransferase [Pseudomonadota bacterium]
MCAIVGIVSYRPVNQAIYDAMIVLQHRGQNSAGIMTDDRGTLCVRKSDGLVRDVFQQRHMTRLR